MVQNSIPTCTIRLMPQLLTCPQGHRWELPESNGGSTGLQVLCPVCGAAPLAVVPRGTAPGQRDGAEAESAPASAETGTYHGPGGDQSEAETLTPKLQAGAEGIMEVLPAPEELIPAPEIA